MENDLHLTQIALVVVAALGCGLLFERFRQPAVLGYILAGVILGPSAFGLVQDREFINALAEIGILLLLFLLGLELEIKSFKTHWWISVVTVLTQICVTLTVVLGLGVLFRLPFGLSALLGFAIALSSTAVAIKMLESVGHLQSESGRVALGILIAQDLAVVPIILILRSINSPVLNPLIFIRIGSAVLILGVFLWFLGRRDKITLPYIEHISGHGDLKHLAAMVFCFGAASISGLLGLSAAYGSFLGGLILGNTRQASVMIESTHPIQSLLLMVFFLSIGLLMDFHFIWTHFGTVLALLILITLGKTALNIGILHFLRLPWPQAFLAGLILSQMGEFAFLLATVGLQSGLIDESGNRMVVSLAVLSLTFSPLWLAAAQRFQALAPKQIQSFHQLLESVYGPQLEYIARLTRPVQTGFFWVWTHLKSIKKRRHSEADSQNSKDFDAPLS